MATRALPTHLWLTLAILFVQIILNVFGGSVLLYALSDMPTPGPLYFVVWFSLLASAVLAVSALFLVLRNPWARYPVLGIEAIAMVSGLIALLTTGATTGFANIAFGLAVIVMLTRPEVRGWLADVRTPPVPWQLPADFAGRDAAGRPDVTVSAWTSGLAATPPSAATGPGSARSAAHPPGSCGPTGSWP